MRRMAGAVIAVLLLAGLGSANVAGQDRVQRRPGEAEFVQYCASCHGMSGRGDGPVAASLKTAPADLTKLGERYGTPLPRPQLVRMIDGTQLSYAHGDREMPVWGKQLFDQGASADRASRVRGTILVIIEYLESIQAPG